MRVITNERFVKNRRRFGIVATVAGFACLIAGFAISIQFPDFIVLAYASLIPGFLLVNYGKFNTIRWGVKPRIDEAMANALKTLDHRHRMLNYLSSLPVDNLLLTPSGLTVLEARPFFGEISNRGSRWARKRGLMSFMMFLGEGGLGNPTRETNRSIAGLRKYLVERMGADDAERVPIDGVIVFTHPQAKVDVQEPEVAATHVRDLKAALRKSPTPPRLTSDIYRKLTQALSVDEG